MDNSSRTLYVFFFLSIAGPEDDSNVCVKWGRGATRDILDGLWKLGKSIAVLGTFTTVPVAALNVFLIWSRFPVEWFYPLIAVHLLNSFWSFMLLIGLRSDLCDYVTCVLARAGYIAIAAGFLWLLAAIMLLQIRKLESEMPDPEPYGVDLIDRETEKPLALPAPEQRLALPAPGDDEEDAPSLSRRGSKRNKAPPNSTREVPLALPPSETASSYQETPTSPKPKRQSSAKKFSASSSSRTDATAPDSPAPPGSRASASRSPRKGTKKSISDKSMVSTSGTDPPMSPRASSVTKSPKRRSLESTPESSGSKKKLTKKKSETRRSTRKPDDIPEI